MKILTDTQLIEQCDLSVRRRRRTELAIVHRLIKDLTKAGYELTYSDGEDMYSEQSEQEGINVLFSVDESTIYTGKSEGRPSGWIALVMGNDGPDVISDYSVSLDKTGIMSAISEWIDKEEAAGRF